MNDLVIIALIASIPPTITAIAALVVAILNRRKVVKTEGKIDQIVEKTIEIHTLTNSTLSRVMASNELLTQKLESLTELIKVMESAKLVADNKIINDRARAGDRRDLK